MGGVGFRRHVRQCGLCGVKPVDQACRRCGDRRLCLGKVVRCDTGSVGPLAHGVAQRGNLCEHGVDITGQAGDSRFGACQLLSGRGIGIADL